MFFVFGSWVFDNLLLQATLPSFWVTAELKGPLAQSSETLNKGKMPRGTNLIGRGALSMCLNPPAIVCRKQDCRMEAGLPRKRGAQSSLGSGHLALPLAAWLFQEGEGVFLKGPKVVWNQL